MRASLSSTAGAKRIRGGLTMMTGTTHFIMRSGRRTAMAEIPTPDFAVPYLGEREKRSHHRQPDDRRLST